MNDDSTATVVRRRVVLEGVRLHYRVAGRGRGGVPTVLLPAPGDSSGSMDALLAELGAARLAFALDLPGHGRSGNPPFGRRDPALWLLAWLSRLGFEHCHLVVVDGSVGVALDAVRRSRRTIQSVTLLAPPPGDRPGRVQRVGAALGDRSVPVLRRVSVGRVASRLRSHGAGAFREAMHPRDLASELTALALPLLVIRGERDALAARDDAARLARRARGAFVDLPAAGRHAYRTHARTIAATLERWWTSIETGQATESGDVTVRLQEGER